MRRLFLLLLVLIAIASLLSGCTPANPDRVTELLRRTSTPLPAATPAQAPASLSSPEGQVYRVGNTGGIGVYLRATPNMADKTTAWPDGTRLIALPAPTADGWLRVEAPDKSEGWVPSQYVIPDDEAPRTYVSMRPAPTPQPLDKLFEGLLKAPSPRDDGSKHRWSSSPGYYINLNDDPIPDDNFISLVASAFDVWGAYIPVKPYFLGVTTRSPQQNSDGVNVIGWDPTIGPAGLTSTRWDVVRNQLKEADIRFNPSIARRLPSCVNTLVLHETGHFLGLDEGVAGVMRPTMPPCPEELSPQDIQQIKDLYPPN